jgi:hypothetical protein
MTWKGFIRKGHRDDAIPTQQSNMELLSQAAMTPVDAFLYQMREIEHEGPLSVKRWNTMEPFVAGYLVGYGIGHLGRYNMGCSKPDIISLIERVQGNLKGVSDISLSKHLMDKPTIRASAGGICGIKEGFFGGRSILKAALFKSSAFSLAPGAYFVQDCERAGIQFDYEEQTTILAAFREIEEALPKWREGKPAAVDPSKRTLAPKRGIGAVNPNGQELISTHRGGTPPELWELLCTSRDKDGNECGHQYGVVPSEFPERKCPKCQGGGTGLRVPDLSEFKW